MIDLQSKQIFELSPLIMDRVADSGKIAGMDLVQEFIDRGFKSDIVSTTVAYLVNKGYLLLHGDFTLEFNQEN